MALERPSRAIGFTFGNKMQHDACDFAPVSALGSRFARVSGSANTSAGINRSDFAIEIVPCASRHVSSWVSGLKPSRFRQCVGATPDMDIAFGGEFGGGDGEGGGPRRAFRMPRT
jgi:hypothetical protein